MNSNAHIFDSWRGKTILGAEYSHENYEDTWVTLHFTDGTSFKMFVVAIHADNSWLEVERIKEGTK